MDRDYMRVDMAELKKWNIPIDSKVYWWMHHYTKAVEIENGKIKILFRVPIHYQNSQRNLDEIIFRKVIDSVREQVSEVKDVLWRKGIYLDFEPGDPKADDGNYCDETALLLMPDDVIDYATKKLTQKSGDEVRNAYNTIIKSPNAALGKVNNDFVKIHDFLDTFNDLLDSEFSIVKTIFYPRTWKIGIAYYEYTPSKLSYTLYPIGLDKNDVQIKEVDKNLHDTIQKEGLGFTVHSVENPIETRPREYAKEIIRSKVFKLLENKLLSHAGNDFLAREFVFAFVDKFHVQLGLTKKGTYTIREIEKAFYQYLPLWVEEAANFMVSVKRNGKNKLADCSTIDMLRGGQRYFDPDSMIRQIMEDERKDIEDKVKVRLKDEMVIIPNWPIGNQKLLHGVFMELFTYLRNTQDEITRPYNPKDFHRLKNWVWEVFSKKDAEQNLKTFFENLPSVYKTILGSNFRILKNELSLFSKADKIIVTFAVKDEYISFQDRPSYKMFYLKSENKNVERSIEVLTDKQAEEFNNFDWEKREIDYQKNKYKVVPILSSDLNFIYEDTPMLDFVYHLLDDRLKEYFKIKNKE